MMFLIFRASVKSFVIGKWVWFVVLAKVGEIYWSINLLFVVICSRLLGDRQCLLGKIGR